MTLLSILQDVAGEVPVAVPSIVVGSSDRTAQLLLACAQAAGKSLARRPQNGWLAQVLEHTFTTVSGTSDYTLPGDFLKMVDGTLWDRSRFWEMRGPLSPGEWQLYKSSVLGSSASTQRRWRVRVPSGSAAGVAPTFSIDPAVSDTGATLVFEYVSSAWCKSALGVAQTAWTMDTDVGILDEYLLERETLWRVLHRLGLDYAIAYAEATQEADKAMSADGGAPVINSTPGTGSVLLGPWNVPEGNYG